MDQPSKLQFALLNTMNDVVAAIRRDANTDKQVFDSLRDALMSTGLRADNRLVAVIEALKTDRERLAEFDVLYERWLDVQVIGLSNRIKTSRAYQHGIYGCDREFTAHIATLKGTSAEELNAKAMAGLAKIKEDDSELYELLTVGYRGWYFENNCLDGVDGGNNSLVTNRIATLQNNIEKLEWLYNHLEDNTSKKSLNALIESWLTFSMQDALKVSLRSDSVVNTDIFPMYGDEVFVDCGAYVGDTVAEFVNVFNNSYRRIHTYEISEPTVDIMKENLKGLDNVVHNVKGVGSRSGELSLTNPHGVDAPFHGNRLVHGAGITKVPVVKLDDDVRDPMSFLKIDVEGLDKETLLGASSQIAQNHPKMHVDTYHKLADVFDVPILIHNIDPTYKFYLRILNSVDEPMMFAVTCIYAV